MKELWIVLFNSIVEGGIMAGYIVAGAVLLTLAVAMGPVLLPAYVVKKYVF